MVNIQSDTELQHITDKQSPPSTNSPVSPITPEEVATAQKIVSRIPTGALVSEITEIENDESPNRKGT